MLAIRPDALSVDLDRQDLEYVRVRTESQAVSKAAEKVYLVGGEMADDSGTANVTIVMSGTDFRVKPMWMHTDLTRQAAERMLTMQWQAAGADPGVLRYLVRHQVSQSDSR